MRRSLYRRGIRLGKHCCQEFSAWQEPARANCGGALPEYPSPSNKFLSHAESLADIARQLRFLVAACFPLRRMPS
jgi:hypothetical protein